NYAKTRGLEIVLHNQPLGIASAMQIHLHAAFYHDINHPTELFGQEMLEDDLILKPLNYFNGYVEIPKQSGLGVELDEKALEKYATEKTIAI
ncbi:MAG: enolase C-terminal domain-like protein, partial [Promethearchaeota archaeon]